MTHQQMIKKSPHKPDRLRRPETIAEAVRGCVVAEEQMTLRLMVIAKAQREYEMWGRRRKFCEEVMRDLASRDLLPTEPKPKNGRPRS